ncbi:Exosome component 10 [Portunus trituberculatus]|uniref:Exosome component 10 n=1 Tax=Portunus trituberculatus TaxID=210409 RepID=A0A5B7EXH1_PORTR|nr:Exosome component 10 [Portunus trituberculatus]
MHAWLWQHLSLSCPVFTMAPKRPSASPAGGDTPDTSGTTSVIHGADYDILWLQRDCGVYVVNLFDTHQAAVVLEYPSRSLAALLLHFCQIQANKVFQRADWRIRPLTQEFVDYARQDSHYLLYIYDLMRNELIEKGNQLNNLITAVYQRSVDLCLKIKDTPVVQPMAAQAPEPDELSHSLNCKHDLSQCDENPTDLPTLLNPRETLLGNLFTEPETSIIFKKKSDMFGELKCTKVHTDSVADIKDIMQFMSPYERYSAYIEMRPFLEGGKRKRETEADDLERVSRVRDHFLCLSKNTVHVPEEIGRVAANHQVEVEAPVTVDGLVIDQAEKEAEDKKQLSEEVEGKLHTNTAKKTNKAEKVKKIKKHSQFKPMVLEKKIKGKKAKNKALKRKSCEDGETPHKMQRTNAGPNAVVGEAQEETPDNSEHVEGNTGQETATAAFDYEAADYSMFQKAKNKAMKSQKVREKFKGKNHKNKKGKSSMKSFTWGAQKGKW